jgi:replication-associated recombination protein RarA
LRCARALADADKGLDSWTYVKQEYLPKQLSRRIFYEATEQGNESKIRLNQQRRREQ